MTELSWDLWVRGTLKKNKTIIIPYFLLGWQKNSELIEVDGYGDISSNDEAINNFYIVKI